MTMQRYRTGFIMKIMAGMSRHDVYDGTGRGNDGRFATASYFDLFLVSESPVVFPYHHLNIHHHFGIGFRMKTIDTQIARHNSGVV
jgi:hypothetical protein